MLTRKQLTSFEDAAVRAWWDANDPNDEVYQHCDNFRYARPGQLDQIAAYEAAAENGCCGSVDVKLALPGGEELMFGFNYGH
jgi:hypothetical protein